MVTTVARGPLVCGRFMVHRATVRAKGQSRIQVGSFEILTDTSLASEPIAPSVFAR